MSLPRYPEYKDSGVEWLGEVPGHWEVVPFYSVAKEREEPNKGMEEDNLLSLSYGRIVQKDITSNDGLLPESFETYQIVRQGDIVFRLTDLQNDKRSLRTAIVEETGIITAAYLAAMPFSIAPRYLNHLLRAYDMLKVFYSMGGGLRQSMKFSDIKRLPTLFPPHEEQRTIAAFLDRETGKIDALIAEQQRLVELLAEKRQAVISHAVTKGLNPNAPMKDSGIEWLGEVPGHWRIAKLKHLAQFSGGGTPNREKMAYWNGDIPWVSPKDMKREFIDSAEESITPDGLQNSTAALLPTGRVLMVVRSGILQHTIPVAINVVPVTLNQDMKALSFKVDECFNKFFLRWVQGLNDLLLLAWAKQGATVESIEHAYLAETIVPLPSIEEQQAIVAFLDSETEKFDTLTTEANRAIALLQERRSALISAAVTGKIDVRSWL